jgi:Chemotaxis protein CheC, inhibitor of MCP methylation
MRLNVNSKQKKPKYYISEFFYEYEVGIALIGSELLNDSPGCVNELWSDVLGEIANIGSGHAATSLSALLGRPITQSLPKVKILPLSEVASALGGAEKIAAAGMLTISGDVSGYLVMMLDINQAEKIVSMVKGVPSKNNGKPNLQRFSALDKSVLSETVNIIGGSYLTAVCEFTDLKAMPSIPYLCVDMVGAVMNMAIAEIGKTGDYVILFQSELSNDEESIIDDLFLIPDETSCGKIMASLGLSDGIK